MSGELAKYAASGEPHGENDGPLAEYAGAGHGEAGAGVPVQFVVSDGVGGHCQANGEDAAENIGHAGAVFRNGGEENDPKADGCVCWPSSPAVPCV
ncbi:hypothetical protein FACS189481_1690 [Clostridia bacterium]|nr:hypothetical protein FACS189481_1690 [Clostridia bacterium]